MANELLKPIYKMVYGESFDATIFESRMEMQKAIYILQEAGISAGDYDFLWYKHGLYCQDLQDDILSSEITPDIEIKYSEDAKEILKRMTEVFKTKVKYSRSQWVECLASLQYLRANVFSYDEKEETIIDELMKRKPHLNDKDFNELAMQKILYILG